MKDEEDRVLAVMEARALRETRVLAGEFARAAAEDKEAILAGLEFEKWLAETCRIARMPARIWI